MSVAMRELQAETWPAANEDLIGDEALRLHGKLRHVGWSRAECELIAPLTLRINQLKIERNALLLAHSYQTPDILYGVADFSADSLALSQEAGKTSADVIVFAGVRFMAETAKILNPGKTVLLPSPNAGCSLSQSITAADVLALKARHPGVPVVCYVNTSAEVKAVSDACCTSANSLAVVEDMPGDKVIFIPDKFMAANLRPRTKKEVIGWEGTCIVHEEFGAPEAESFRRQYPDAALLAHTECVPSVVAAADMAGSTSGMEKYIAQHPEKKRFMLVTECGMSDKLQVQYPDRQFIGSCVICPFMKKIELRNILRALEDPLSEQRIELAPETIASARKAIDRMLAVGRSDRAK